MESIIIHIDEREMNELDGLPIQNDVTMELSSIPLPPNETTMLKPTVSATAMAGTLLPPHPPLLHWPCHRTQPQLP